MRLILLRKAGRLQLIQNSAPSVAWRHQCDIRIDCRTVLCIMCEGQNFHHTVMQQAVIGKNDLSLNKIKEKI